MNRSSQTALLLVALLLATTFPAWWRPDLVTAWPLGEADNHVWMHWQAAHAGQVWANYPEGTGLPLMDAVNLPLFHLGFRVDPAFAWNVVWLWNVMLALAGGFALGWVATDRLEGGWAGAALLGSWPYLHGVGAFGLTEAWPIGWWALHGAALVLFGRTRQSPIGLVATGALLAFVLSGWYNALFAAIGAPFLGGWAWWRTRPWDRSMWLVVVGGGLICALALLPSLLVFEASRDVWSLRGTEALPPAHDPGWLTGPAGGADLLALVLPRPDAVPSGRSTYVGLVALALAVLGATRSWARADGRLYLLGGIAIFAILALGTWLRVAGWRVMPLPAAVFDDLRALRGVHHWYRALGPLGVLLVPFVAEGVVRIADRAASWRWTPSGWALVACAALALDATLLSANPWPREQYDPRPPEAVAAIPGLGAVVLLPFDNGREEFGPGVPRLYERWGPWLGRPIAESYDGPDALLGNRLIASADRACGVPPRVPSAWRPSEAFADPGRLDPPVVEAALASLAAARVDRVVLLVERAPAAEACSRVLSEALGPPESDRDGVRVWRVPWEADQAGSP